MTTDYHTGVMPIENLNHGRDAKGPAEKTTRTDEEILNRITEGFPERPEPGYTPEGPEELLQLHEANARIHAGRLYLTGMAPGSLPARLVKRVDQFSLKVLKSHVRRYCV